MFFYAERSFYIKRSFFYLEELPPFFYLEELPPFFYVEELSPFFSVKLPALFPELRYINDMTVKEVTVKEATVKEATVKEVTVKEATVKEVTVKTVKCITPSNKPSKVYTRKQRWEKIKRWKEKKARFFSSRPSTCRYPIRQQYSVTRPRVKGKFC